MESQEIANAYFSGSRLQVEAAPDLWINCVIRDIQPGLVDMAGNETRISRVNLMILDPQGCPANVPTQELSYENFHRLRNQA